MTVGRPRIEITVAPDGTASARTLGIRGERCLDYIAVLEDLLGAETVSSVYTAEYRSTVDTVDEVEDDVDPA